VNTAKWIAVVIYGFAVMGCGSDTEAPREKTGIEKLPAGWNTIAPGGRTMCARGAPYVFLVRPGTVNRVLLELEGGGSCYSPGTCAPGAGIMTDTVVVDEWVSDTDQAVGIHDHADSRNPFRDWHHVFVKYCTGDGHWGDADREYENGSQKFTIHHRGAVNVRAVLDWLAENVPHPDEVFVTGMSGGAYGSIMWAPHVARQYPKAKITHLADGGAGVITELFLQIGLEQWNGAASYPSFIPGADLAGTTKLSQLYTLVASGYPDMQLAQYNTAFDSEQEWRFELMGGNREDWAAMMRANLKEIEDAVPSFRRYIAPSWVHTILGDPGLYAMKSDGVPVVDWIEGLRARTASSVDCEPHCGGRYFSSDPAGWACASSTPSEPVVAEEKLELSLRVLHFPAPYDTSDLAPFEGLDVSGFAHDDPTCSNPLGPCATNGQGLAKVQLDSSSNGFDGVFRIESTAHDLVPTRLSLYPPIRTPQHPMVFGKGYTVPTKKAAQKLADQLGVSLDATKGWVFVDLLDCNLSWRFDASATLDGQSPTAYLWGSTFVSSAPTPNPIFPNVEPGEHTLAESLASDGTPLASRSITVVAGEFVVAAIAPRDTQP